MEIEKVFKNLILADFIIIILMVISSMYQPDEISNIYKNLNDGLLSNFENFSRIVSISLFFLYLFTLNLLYRFISYGKTLYFFLVIAGLMLNYFSGSVIYSAFSGILDQVGGIITGAILILLFFSPIKNNFR
ncbi:hypothetical protein OBA41_04540 [Pelagibacteraceae bacterium]|nr:hypothetical protein [Pelagibacteraceae bacterium]